MFRDDIHAEELERDQRKSVRGRMREESVVSLSIFPMSGNTRHGGPIPILAAEKQILVISDDNPVTNVATVVTAMRPKAFSRAENEEVKDFFRGFEFVAAAKNWTTEPVQISQLIICLQGHAEK